MAPTLEQEPAFALQNVGFDYPDGHTALQALSLRIMQGERIAILGANGCGKSTLIKILNGLLFPTRGTLTAYGMPVSEAAFRLPEAAFRFRRKVGFVFQNSDAQLFSPTVREELAFAPLQIGVSPDEALGRVDDVARLLRIEGLLDRSPFQLSGGEKKKVAIACVLTMNPDALLLDEPTNGLDPRSRAELTALLERLQEAGKTLTIATHDLDFARVLSSRCYVLGENHRLAAEGSTSEALADRALLRLANLIA